VSASEPHGFVVASLGCKVNQAEAAWLGDQLRARGLVRAGRGRQASAAVLMTCAVTAAAARQSRQAARRLARAHPGALVVAAGCGAQAEPEAYAEAGAAVAGRHGLAGLPELLARGEAPAGPPGPPGGGPWCPGEQAPGRRRTRGLLKLQDGCDANCAYCIVPRLRGGPRSLDPEPSGRALARLGRGGAAEVVLTGVHLGRWGRDLPGRPELAGLLPRLLEAHPLPRLRLSSLEAGEITPELLELLAAEDRICPHLHVPLQTGSDRLLAAMGRPYSAGRYARVVQEAAEAVPGLCLGADVMVGLPGEDEEAFRQTRELLRRLPLAYLHVFPYSPRPGTPAAEMPGRPPERVARARAAELRELGAAKRLAFYQAQVGRSLVVVAEAAGRGRSQNYCLVELGPAARPGQVVEARARGVALDRDQPVLTI
jgi:threonylcarbamoyladenosine tRNA methylthiotransferase MtaB